jgi:glucan phosphorylase
MIVSEHYSQLAERCTQLAIACSTPSLAGALTRLAADYVAQSHRLGQPSAWEQPRQLKIDPLGFGD